MKNLLKTSSLLLALFAILAISFVACDKVATDISDEVPTVVGAKKDGVFKFKDKATLQSSWEAKLKESDPSAKLDNIRFAEQTLVDGTTVNVVLARDLDQKTTHGMTLEEFEGNLQSSKVQSSVSCTGTNCIQGECVPYVSATIELDGRKVHIWDCTSCASPGSCTKKSRVDADPIPIEP